MKISYAILSILILNTSLFAEAPKDPRMGTLTYYGTGRAERSPDYGELRFVFNVDCQNSATAVASEIQKISQKVWNTITEANANRYTETERTYWGDIQDVDAYDPTQIITVGEARSVIRRNACTGKTLSFKDAVPSAYRGTQSFGVRTANLDLLESLAKEVKKIPQTSNPAEVKITVGTIQYAVTSETQNQMNAEVENQATELAIGAGSEFEVDQKLLKFTEARFIGRRPAGYVPLLGETIGEPVKSGEPSRVSLKLKMRYGFRIETSDLLRDKSSRRIGDLAESNSVYEVDGEAQAVADYAETSIDVTSRCHASEAEAAQALELKFSKIVDLARGLQGSKVKSQTDRYSFNEGESAAHSSLIAIEFSGEGNNRVATKYFDPCKTEVVNENEARNISSSRVYYEAAKAISIRSSNFSGLIDLTRSVAQLNDENPAAAAVGVRISTPEGKITEATKKTLTIQARKNASAQLLDQQSALFRESKNMGRFSYRNAHLVSVDLVASRPSLSAARGMPMAAGVMDKSASFGAGASETLSLQIETRDNSTRPTISLNKTLAFDLRVLTQNFLDAAPTN